MMPCLERAAFLDGVRTERRAKGRSVMNIFRTLGTMYLTLLAPITAGILNSLWCSVPCMKALQCPMDGGRTLADGRRIFGDNKTWKGFLGYLFFNMLGMVFWGSVCKAAGLEAYNFFYMDGGTPNTLPVNLLIGLLLGLAYGVFELPNSFLKRRMGIVPGKRATGRTKVFFSFLDQVDSVCGCVLAVCLFHPMSLVFYLAYVAVGALTHMMLDVMLYVLKLRKNMF